MYDIVAIGELLIDFVPSGTTKEGTALFEQNPGGAPGNVLAIAAKLGKKTGLISKVGEDRFGKFLKGVMYDIGVDTRGIVSSPDTNTTLAFVHLNDKGDRSFSFYRKPGADVLLQESEVDKEMVRSCKIFHFGTVSMTHNPSREATMYAVETARDGGAIISFDPNLRAPLWDNLEEAKEMIGKGLKYANILKISHEELEFITGEKNPEKGSKIIRDIYGITLILVTLGPGGCFYRAGANTGTFPAYDVATIDTTGAGDAFLGAFLCHIIESGKEIGNLTKKEIDEMVDFANAAGSLASTKKGAIPAMPSADEIKECMRTCGKLAY